ncbi:MAG: hypothetical protein PSU94_18225 [Lacunisphaera sp.]|nr:hypothetical protein [Lacunisphaera sp.]
MRPNFSNHLRLALVAGGLALGPALAAEDTLRTVLTTEEYQRAGLAKLSAEEQAALLQAMQRRGLAKPEAPAPVVAVKPAEKKGLLARVMDFGAEQLPAKKSAVEVEEPEVAAQMTEPFRGLQGGTIFRLDNGQVWQQRIPETYYVGKSIPNPKVTIRRTRLGYRLLIPAVEPDFAVAVKRIQ